MKLDREGKKRTAYSLRHTYISLRLMEGANPPLSKSLQLPDFQQSNSLLYPPPQRLDMSVLVPIPYDARYSADWSDVEKERAAAVQAEHERVAAYNEERARLRVEREKAGL